MSQFKCSVENKTTHILISLEEIIYLSGVHVCVCTGCTGGVGRGGVLSNAVGSGGGHGGKGGPGCYNGSCVEGGISYGNANLPCELGSGSGDESLADSTAGGGIIGGSIVHHLVTILL